MCYIKELIKFVEYSDEFTAVKRKAWTTCGFTRNFIASNSFQVYGGDERDNNRSTPFTRYRIGFIQCSSSPIAYALRLTDHRLLYGLQFVFFPDLISKLTAAQDTARFSYIHLAVHVFHTHTTCTTDTRARTYRRNPSGTMDGLFVLKKRRNQIQDFLYWPTPVWSFVRFVSHPKTVYVQDYRRRHTHRMDRVVSLRENLYIIMYTYIYICIWNKYDRRSIEVLL